MKKIALVLGISFLAGLSVMAQKSATFVHGDKAIRGYDPVAYFTESKPVKGSEKLRYNWNNTNRYFSTQQNLDMFLKQTRRNMRRSTAATVPTVCPMAIKHRLMPMHGRLRMVNRI